MGTFLLSAPALGAPAPSPSAGGAALEGVLAQGDEPFSVEQSIEYLVEKFKAGGITMWVLLFLSVLGLAFLLERLFRLRRKSVAPGGLVETATSLWEQGRVEEIEAICSRDCPLLCTYDIVGWSALARRLTEGSDSPGPGKRIWELLTPEAQKVLQAAAAPGAAELTDTQQGAVIGALNAILKRPDLYTEGDFGGVALPSEAQSVFATDVTTVSEQAIRKANRLLLTACFPRIVRVVGKKRESTLGRIIAFMVRKRHSPIDVVGEAASDIAGRDMAGHEMLMYPLAAVATLSPLLGLFGTVIGMIESFETVAVAGSMGDPTLLATGISKALVTTAFGLFVAIPMLFFYNMLRLRTDFLNKLLEGEASALISDWFIPEGDKRS